MHISPAMLEAAYCYLLTTPPMNRWALPPVDDVEFRIDSHPDRRGWHRLDNSRHIIGISAKCVGRTDSLMATMAHEICHMYCDRRGVKAEHGRDFLRCAARVCKEHGFDERLF